MNVDCESIVSTPIGVGVVSFTEANKVARQALSWGRVGARREHKNACHLDRATHDQVDESGKER